MRDDAPKPSHAHENAPSGWLQNDLTSMMNVAHENRWATFHNMRAECDKLTAIYKLFGDVSRGWINPKQNLIACNLFLRAHSTFFASCNLAFGGHVAETYPLTRLTLEYSASALRICRDDKLAAVFLNRHDDDASYRASKKAFGTADLKACVRAEDAKLADTFDELYHASIDRGAHLNERGLSSSGHTLDRDDGGKQFFQLVLQKDPRRIKHTLRHVIEVGICALDVLEIVFRARYELLGVREGVLRLKGY